jgi:Uma2 family endonuclease
MSDIAYIPRYSIEDYLSWEGDWELWDGYAVSMSPSPGYRHQRLALRLLLRLEQALGEREACGDCQLVYEIDWHVDAGTVVRPDLLILCGEPPVDFVKRSPTFIAEVLSPATARKDRTYKRALYESKGVASYLLVDPDLRTLELLRLDPGGSYQAAEDLIVPLHPGCEIAIETAGLLA